MDERDEERQTSRGTTSPREPDAGVRRAPADPQDPPAEPDEPLNPA